MRVCVVDHQGCGVPFADAMRSRGVELIFGKDFDVLLVDYVSGWGGGRLALAEACRARGGSVVGIPHGGPPVFAVDGCVEPYPTDVELVPAVGHQRFYEIAGFPSRVEVVGWALSDVRPWRPRPVRRLLFAPAHPFSGDDGQTFLPLWQEANARAYRQFLQYPCERRIVRAYGTLEANGIWQDNRVHEWEWADLQAASACRSIESADAVIGDGTFLYLAAAMGIPSAAITQPRPHDDFATREVSNWEQYRDFVRYPYCLDEMRLDDALLEAQDEPEQWRADMIGEPLDPDRLVEVVGSVARRPNRAERRRRRR